MRTAWRKCCIGEFVICRPTTAVHRCATLETAASRRTRDGCEHGARLQQILTTIDVSDDDAPTPPVERYKGPSLEASAYARSELWNGNAKRARKAPRRHA